MYLYYNLLKYQADNLLIDVSDYRSFVKVQLSLLETLFLWTGNSNNHTRPFFCVDFNTLHRAFIINFDAHKMISLAFPFLIKTSSEDWNDTNNYVKEIHYLGQGGQISSRHISEAKTILEGLKQGDLYRDIKTDDEDNIAPESFRLLEFLLFKEAGYIRYDYSTQGFNPVNHPINHFDVNYSPPAHFKLGLDRHVSLEQFMTIIDLKKQCSLLNLTPPLYELFKNKKQQRR